MKSRDRILVCTVLTLAIPQAFLPRAKADNLFWDGTRTGWNNSLAWSTSDASDTPDPSAPPGSGDLAIFNITGLTSPQAINLNGPQSAAGLLVSSPGSVLIQPGTGTSSLSLGASGITLNASSGATTLASPVSLSASQTWTNNSPNPFTLNGSLATGANAVTFQGPGKFNLNGAISSDTSNSSTGLNMLGTGSLTLSGITSLDANLNIVSGTVSVNSAFSNNGQISLASTTSRLTGASLINNGTIRGSGSIYNVIANNGLIQPDGCLHVYMTTNSSTGIISLSTGSGLFFLSSVQPPAFPMLNNYGTISLASPTCFLSGTYITNYGSIIGCGSLFDIKEQVDNQGIIEPLGGKLSVHLMRNTGLLRISAGNALFVSTPPPMWPYYQIGGTVSLSGGTLALSQNLDFTGQLSGFGTLSSYGKNRGSITLSGGPSTITGQFTNSAEGSIDIKSDPVVFNAPFVNYGTIKANSATVTFTDLTLAGGRTTLQFGTTTLSTLTLTHTGTAYDGQLDLTDSTLILQSSSPADKLAKITTLLPALLAGSANGTWTGKGITSSTAAQDPAHYAVALFDNADLQLSTIGNQPVDPNFLLITLAHLGDANFNGIVDIQDQSLITNHWQTPQNSWSSGDLNLDGTVDLQDLTLVTNNWQQSSTISQLLITNYQLPPTPIPEPFTLPLLTIPILLTLVKKPRSPHHRN